MLTQRYELRWKHTRRDTVQYKNYKLKHSGRNFIASEEEMRKLKPCTDMEIVPCFDRCQLTITWGMSKLYQRCTL